VGDHARTPLGALHVIAQPVTVEMGSRAQVTVLKVVNGITALSFFPAD